MEEYRDKAKEGGATKVDELGQLGSNRGGPRGGMKNSFPIDNGTVGTDREVPGGQLPRLGGGRIGTRWGQ